MVTVNVDSEQKSLHAGRNFEGKLIFNSALVVNAGDIDENGNTDLAMGLHLMVTAESTEYSFNL